MNTRCNHCGSSFSRQFDMFKHIREAHELPPFHCHVRGCGASFMWNKELRLHRQSEHSVVLSSRTNTRCDECGECFSTESNLRRHLRRIHSDRTWYEMEMVKIWLALEDAYTIILAIFHDDFCCLSRWLLLLFACFWQSAYKHSLYGHRRNTISGKSRTGPSGNDDKTSLHISGLALTNTLPFEDPQDRRQKHFNYCQWTQRPVTIGMSYFDFTRFSRKFGRHL